MCARGGRVRSVHVGGEESGWSVCCVYFDTHTYIHIHTGYQVYGIKSVLEFVDRKLPRGIVTSYDITLSHRIRGRA